MTFPIARGWSPEYLVKWLFDQNEIWVRVVDGSEPILIQDMSLGHVLNTLLFLERSALDLAECGIAVESLQDTALYSALYRRAMDALEPPDLEPTEGNEASPPEDPDLDGEDVMQGFGYLIRQLFRNGSTDEPYAADLGSDKGS